MRRTIVVLAAALVAQPIAAQGNPQTRQGFAISFGFGSGSAGFTCDGCGTDREGSSTGYLRIGGTVRPDLVISGEVNAWTKEDGGAKLTTGTVNAVAQWYPKPTGGFFLLGGIGAGTIEIEFDGTFVDARREGNGLGYQVGTGYDWRVGKNFSLSPFATYFATGGIKFNDDKLDSNVFTIGLGFSWH